jgi:hypothetical protein
MLTLDQIKLALKDRRLDAVSEATKLHVNTIANIRDGRTETPTYYVLSRLSDYLE